MCAWTYSGDPKSSVKDEIRFLVGDTDTNEQLTSDEEIAYAIDSNATTRESAQSIARSIIAKFARMVTFSTPQGRIELQQRAETYKTLVADLLSGSKAGAIFKVD